MRFTKAHGLGNDFIITDDRQGAFCENLPALARRLCHRRTGIGADGLVFVRESESCDVRMQLFNSDGSEAEMCGNGVRCFAKYIYDKGIVKKESLSVETLAGPQRIELTVENGAVSSVRVNMGRPMREKALIPMLGDGVCDRESLEVNNQTLRFSALLMGVPHAAVFVEALPDEEAFLSLGRTIERLPLFPRGVNVNFTRVLDAHNIEVRTFERGCGPTLACGTGSSAAAVCCAIAGFTGRSVTVHLVLGVLDILWDADDCVYMKGPAAFSFEGDAC